MKTTTDADRTTIEICSSVHQFQRRHCWMLSSILQQQGFDLNRVRICSAYIEDTGEPTTREVLDYFAGLTSVDKATLPVPERDVHTLPLKIADHIYALSHPGVRYHHIPYPDDTEFMRRGNVRNRHVEEAEADWIAFMDCDMVLPPDWLATLMPILASDEFKDYDGCLYAGRYSTELEPTELLVDSDPARYPCVVPDAWDQITGIPAKRKSNIGAGYLHLCRTVWIRDVRGYYVPPGEAADWDWHKRHSKCRSDTQFRRDVGKKKLPIHRMYHIQHQRDKEHGKHIELQR
jgi:hypothetical protein